MDDWFENINWSGECLLCQAKHDGKCPDIDCAKINYDVNGNKIPLYAWNKDGNTLDKYLMKGE